MTRSAKTARRAGIAFRRLVAGFLRAALGDARISARSGNGRELAGDIRSVRTIRGAELVIECKDHNRTELGLWLHEAQVTAAQIGAVAGVVVHKRKRAQAAEAQYVTMSLATFAWLLAGGPDNEREVTADPHTVVIENLTIHNPTLDLPGYGLGALVA